MNKHIIFETPWFNLESEDFPELQQLGGKPIYRMNVPESVLILCFTEDSKIIIVRQFRPALNKYTLELPAGSIDKNEKPVFAAHRELLEETGYECESFTQLIRGHAVIDRIKGDIFVFCG